MFFAIRYFNRLGADIVAIQVRPEQKQDEEWSSNEIIKQSPGFVLAHNGDILEKL
jgi:hypothetical protein